MQLEENTFMNSSKQDSRISARHRVPCCVQPVTQTASDLVLENLGVGQEISYRCNMKATEMAVHTLRPIQTHTDFQRQNRYRANQTVPIYMTEYKMWQY